MSATFQSVHTSHALQTPPVINLALYCLLKHSVFFPITPPNYLVIILQKHIGLLLLWKMPGKRLTLSLGARQQEYFGLPVLKQAEGRFVWRARIPCAPQQRWGTWKRSDSVSGTCFLPSLGPCTRQLHFALKILHFQRLCLQSVAYQDQRRAFLSALQPGLQLTDTRHLWQTIQQ